VDVSGVGKFLLDRRCRGGLDELAEPGAGVREPPRRELDPEPLQRCANAIDLE
jgi:hypothetical protein